MANNQLFTLPELQQNSNGWGPASPDVTEVMKSFVNMPFQLYNKCDRVGRVVDWLGVERYKKNDTRKYFILFLFGF